MSPPVRWFEDHYPGEITTFGDFEMTEAEIVGFARRYDPQPFHVDPAAAQGSIFGGLIASGWNTVGAVMHLLVKHYLAPEASLGSPGIDELRWLRPVRPGDRLSVRVTVQECIPSRSKPDRGTVRSLIEALNQNGETVMSMRPMIMFRTRPVG